MNAAEFHATRQFSPANLITSKHRYHRGLRFDVWTSSSSWFWRLDGPDRNRGTIGAAADEAEAVREACAMIEEMTGADRPGPVP